LNFFNRTENHNFQANSASAKDFADGYHPFSDMQKLGEKSKGISTRINEQVSHVGFCRKTEQWDKLGLTEMIGVKAIIDKETLRFVAKLKPSFAQYWKDSRRQPLASFLNVNNHAVCTTNAIMTMTLVVAARSDNSQQNS
jgi:hypothetical protein